MGWDFFLKNKNKKIKNKKIIDYVNFTSEGKQKKTTSSINNIHLFIFNHSSRNKYPSNSNSTFFDKFLTNSLSILHLYKGKEHPFRFTFWSN